MSGKHAYRLVKITCLGAIFSACRSQAVHYICTSLSVPNDLVHKATCKPDMESQP